MDEAEILRRLSDQARINALDFISFEPVRGLEGEPLLTETGHPVYRAFVDAAKIQALGKGPPGSRRRSSPKDEDED